MRNGIIVPSLVSTLHAVIVSYHPDGMSIQQRQNIFHYGYTGFLPQVRRLNLRICGFSSFRATGQCVFVRKVVHGTKN